MHVTSHRTSPLEACWDFSYRSRGKEKLGVSPEENQHHLTSEYIFLRNAGLISSDGHGKTDTTVGEEADTTGSEEASPAGRGEAASTRGGKSSSTSKEDLSEFRCSMSQLNQGLPNGSLS